MSYKRVLNSLSWRKSIGFETFSAEMHTVRGMHFPNQAHYCNSERNMANAANSIEMGSVARRQRRFTFQIKKKRDLHTFIIYAVINFGRYLSNGR